jgi:hypothetical protein
MQKLLNQTLRASAITSAVRGREEIKISEHQIIRILMSTEYRFFNDNSGYIANIFYYDTSWNILDNFILVEILYYLSLNRKKPGNIVLEGYFSVESICDEMERVGYDREDIFHAVNHLLEKQLIIAEHFNFTNVKMEDCVKIQTSGFIHLRILCERIEYLYGVIPVTPFSDDKVVAKLANSINRESQRGYATGAEAARAVELMLEFFKKEKARIRERNPFFDPDRSGAVYVLDAMERAVRRFFKLDEGAKTKSDQLDLL